MLSPRKRLKREREQEGVGPKVQAVVAQAPIVEAAVVAAAAQPLVHPTAVAPAAAAALHILPPPKGKRDVVAAGHFHTRLGAVGAGAIPTETGERGAGVGPR